MKINSDLSKVTSQEKEVSQAKDGRTRSANADNKSASSNSAAKVESFMFTQAKDVLENTEVVDRAKVNEMKAKIAKGQYNIEPDKIADRLIRESFLEDR